MKTEISFTYPQCFACAVYKEFGTKIRFLNRSVKQDVLYEEVELYNEDEAVLEKVVCYLQSYPHIMGCRVLGHSHDGTIARVGISMKGAKCPLNLLIRGFDVGGRLGSVERVDFNGKIHWNLEAKGTRRLEKLQEELQDEFDVRDFMARRLSVKSAMTKSNFLLKEAFERGYFDVPKRISIEELSQELKVPLSTLNIDIRRALRNALVDATC